MERLHPKALYYWGFVPMAKNIPARFVPDLLLTAATLGSHRKSCKRPACSKVNFHHLFREAAGVRDGVCCGCGCGCGCKTGVVIVVVVFVFVFVFGF